MLSALKIENFAIVKQLDLDFNQGLTAFTGETGAGKSIIIDALMLALGERADIAVIRHGEEKCDIQASFMIAAENEVSKWLIEQDIAFEETLILRRILTKEGRSKSYVNGVALPLQKVKELSCMLVDIHGQHQHQTLLNPNTHRTQLDHFANHNAVLKEIAKLYKIYADLKLKLKQIQDAENTQERQALLRFQIEELKAIAPEVDEMEALSQEHSLLYHAKSYLEKSQALLELLNGDEAPSVLRQLHQVTHILFELKSSHPHILNAQELIQNALINCDESLSEIERFADQVTLDPNRLFEVENRMSVLLNAARKYQTTPHDLHLTLSHLEQELQRLEGQEQDITHTQKALDASYEAYLKLANELSQQRAKAAPKLTQAISSIIQELGMPHGEVSLSITPQETPKPYGLDKIEYLVCTNKGGTPQPLNKVASGGELSRISLAIQMITAQKGLTPTLIFDEVDVGIGGATAALVGQHLRALGKRLQVFCVTHQPQVAACAHQHLKVTKYLENNQTYSEITPLTLEHQVEEIARMLGGITLTEQTRSHAKEMITQSTA